MSLRVLVSRVADTRVKTTTTCFVLMATDIPGHRPEDQKSIDHEEHHIFALVVGRRQERDEFCEGFNLWSKETWSRNVGTKRILGSGRRT